MSVQDIFQIVVQYTDGSEEVYRGKGIEKLKRKLGVASQPKPVRVVVDDDDDTDLYTEVEECTGDFCPVPQRATTRGAAATRGSKKSSKRTDSQSQTLSTSVHGGPYHRSGVNYKPTAAGGNIMDLAKSMSQQSGLKFTT
jgi:hypothetical protein